MSEKTSQQPLLSKKLENNNNCDDDITISFGNRAAKWVLKMVMWVVFITWIAFLFLFPSDSVQDLFRGWIHGPEGTGFGITGITFAIFSGPIMLIAILATVYIYLCGEHKVYRKKGGRNPRIELRTLPIVVDGPFGVVSAAEVIGMVVFATYVFWAIWAFTLRNNKVIFEFNIPAQDRSVFMLKLTGLRLGLIGQICVTFLLLPVARGSILLRLTDIPFEHAARYHVWLGHLTMFLFTLHGLFFVIAWFIEGNLIHELTEWKDEGIPNLPGVISLVAGLLMWVTSLPGLRRINFELFFYTHQLYVVFFIFMALHVGHYIFSYVAGAVFLFMLDRFLRFCQSRKTVDVVSARSFPCGTMELVLSKPANLHYNALGWVFLHIRELSWLQWHPFSVSSSPLDGKYHLAILIKVLGDWTKKLEERCSVTETEHFSKITASVEGPYGHESPYYLKYENLILVAGGIGISPFLAIISDILHRINKDKPCLPKNVLIIWAVKTSDEIPLLQTVDMESICPNFCDRLNLQIQTYVTRQSEPSLEEGKSTSFEMVKTIVPPTTYKGCGMSALVGTGNIIWSGLYLIASTIGLVVTVGVLEKLYVIPYNIDCWWYKGLLVMGCMVVSVLLFGGVVIGLWHVWEKNSSLDQTESVTVPPDETSKMHETSSKKQYINTIQYGRRPDMRGIFGTMSEGWGNVDIGVIVCGPPSLQTSVAKECRYRNLSRRSNEAIFHFNTHSFEL